MKIKKRIKTNKIMASKIADELIREDIIYKIMEIDSIIANDQNEASKIRVYLEAIDNAHHYAHLNLKLLRWLEMLYKKSVNNENLAQQIDTILNDIAENLSLLLKYIVTQKLFYEEQEISYDTCSNIVYYSDLNNHMNISNKKISKLYYK